jgi:hypothetical protein
MQFGVVKAGDMATDPLAGRRRHDGEHRGSAV